MTTIQEVEIERLPGTVATAAELDTRMRVLTLLVLLSAMVRDANAQAALGNGMPLPVRDLWPEVVSSAVQLWPGPGAMTGAVQQVAADLGFQIKRHTQHVVGAGGNA